MKFIPNFKQKFTFMLIPHTNKRPIQLRFTLSFILFLGLFWTMLTSWAVFFITRNIDYWRIKVNDQLMSLKVNYFANEIKKSRALVDQVNEIDLQLRDLLKMKSQKAILEQEIVGGPSREDRANLEKLLRGDIGAISLKEMHRQVMLLKNEVRQQLNSWREISDYIDYHRSLYRATPNIPPCEGRKTSGFGWRSDPLNGENEFHQGFDLANEQGSPIYAVADGLVYYCGWEGGYGRLLILDHGFGYRTYYGHLAVNIVKPGDTVRRGQLIALMGRSGRTTGPHLHYEVHYFGSAVSPEKYLNKTAKN